LSVRLGVACRSIQEASTLHGPEAATVEARADFEQTIVNKAMDQWSKQAFVKAKGRYRANEILIVTFSVTLKYFQIINALF